MDIALYGLDGNDRDPRREASKSSTELLGRYRTGFTHDCHALRATCDVDCRSAALAQYT